MVTEHNLDDRLRGEIRAELARRKITHADLSTITGIPVTRLRRRLAGDVPFKFGEVLAIVDALGIDYADLHAKVTNGDAA